MTTGAGLRVAAPDLMRFVQQVLIRLGVPEDEAAIVADVLVSADLRGVDSHGVARFDRYVEALEEGRIHPRAQIKVASEWPALAFLDGGNSLGQVVGYRAMQRCLDMAERAGAACVTAGNSNHYGIAGYYAMMALPRRMIGVSLTNSRPHAAPTFGCKCILGTNPIAMAVPAGKERPWVLDMATTAIPAGKVEVAQRAGKPLRPGLAIDGSGRPTTDPDAVLRREGSLLPLGGLADTAGYKGYGLSVLVDILAGVLPGAGYSAIVQPNWGNSPIGHFFAALRVDAVRPLVDFEAVMERMIRDLRESPKAEGHERIIIHGEPEFEAEEVRRREGIVLQPEVAETLRALAGRLEVTGILPCSP